MRNPILDRMQAIDGDPMRARATSRAALLTGLALALVMAASPASAQIVPPGSMVEGKTIGDWGFMWWQWIFGITSPDPWGDTDGANQNYGQMPPVFYTCGAAGPAAGVPTTRSFTVPADMYILASLSSTAAFYEPGIDPPTLCTVELPAFIDATSSLSFSLDGVPISQVDLFNNHREPSSLGLTSVIVPGNPYFPGKAGSYPDSCGDGYYVMIEPLPPGPHTIECGFTHPVGAVLNHTNEIYVLKPELSYVEAKFDGIGGVDGLGGAIGPVVSRDGANVYVTAFLDSAVAVFARDAGTGVLTFLESHQDGVAGVDGLAGAGGAALSRDGAHLYVRGGTDGALAVFERNPATGALTFLESHQDGVAGVDGLAGAGQVIVSPDGAHVYTAGSLDNAVAVFARDAGTGALIFLDFYQDGIAGVDGLGGATFVTASPDNAHVYVRGDTGNAVAVFARDAGTGLLTFLEFHQDGVAGVDGLAGAGQMIVSPEGAHVYVAGSLDNAVAVFARDAGTGLLTFLEFYQDGVAGVDGLGGASTVAASPDGAHLYVRSNEDNAVAVFERDIGTGTLTFVDLQRDGTYGVDGLGGFGGVTVSRDGAHLYTPAFIDNAVSVFEILHVPEPSAGLLLLSGGTFLLVVGRHKERRQRNRIGRAGS